MSHWHLAILIIFEIRIWVIKKPFPSVSILIVEYCKLQIDSWDLRQFLRLQNQKVDTAISALENLKSPLIMSERKSTANTKFH
jgi:hypothetical protein